MAFNLGLPNKYISYSIVTWLNSLFISFYAASLQSKSFLLNIDYVPIFSLITPITLAIIYYLIKSHHLLLGDKEYPPIMDIAIAFSLSLFFYFFFYFIVFFRENISQLLLIKYVLQLDIFSSSNLFIFLTFILLAATLWLVGVKNRLVIVFFIFFCFILEGFLFLLVINAIYQVNAEPLDFLNSFSKVILSYLITWIIVSIYAALLDRRKDGARIH